MHAVTFDPATDHFAVRDLPVPQPGPGEVRVRVDACGLNPVDAKIIYWKGAATGMNADWVPGLDVAGVVDALGPGVDGWRLGDRVLYHGNMFRPYGGFAEFAIHAAATLTPHPNVPAVEAAAMPCAAWTAYRSLVDKLHVQPGQSLLVIGGAGGVGSFAVQFARYLGMDPIIATCSTHNFDLVRQFGATDVLDYHEGAVGKRVRTLTGGAGVQKAIDTVGYDNDLDAAEALAFEGELVELVDLARPEQYRDAFGRSLSFHQFSLGAAHRNGPAAQARLVEVGRTVAALQEGGAIRPHISSVIPLEQVGDRMIAMLRRTTVGKIVMSNLV